MEDLVDKFQNLVHIWNPEPASIFIIKMFSALIASLLSFSVNTWTPSADVAPYSSYDYIIVGGGTSGLVLGSLLSEKNPNSKILIIEAGTNPPLISEVPYLSTSIQKSRYDWNYRTVEQNQSCKGFSLELCRMPLGKMLGGSDLLQNMIYSTGTKRDWNRWKNLENPEWGWNHVFPYFQNFYLNEPLATYDEFATCCGDQLKDLKKVIYSAANELDIPTAFSEYESITGKIGYGKAFATLKNGTNYHPGWTFFAKAKNKKNICVLQQSFVTKIVIDPQTKVTKGVQYSSNYAYHSIQYVAAKKEVILCAGAINNAKLLMLSGIGPKNHLNQKEIPVIVDLDGVGKNLQDHVQFVGVFHAIKQPLWPDELNEVKATEEFLLKRQGAFTTIGLSSVVGHLYTAKGERSDYPNVQIKHFYIYKNQIKSKFLVQYDLSKKAKLRLNDLNKKMSILVQIPTVLKPKSRGHILLQDSNPFSSPLIDPQYLSHPDDKRAMLSAIKHALAMGNTLPFKKIKAELIDLSDVFCNYCVREDENCIWSCLMEYFTMGSGHPVGTTRMGRCSECSASVVDAQFQVHGVSKLRVADASVMPEIIGGNLYASKIMLAQRAVEFIQNATSVKTLIKYYK